MPAGIIPALIAAGGSIGSSAIAGQAAKSAAQGSPAENAAMGEQTALAGQQRQQGQQLFDAGLPAAKQTLGYYTSLLSGRAKQQAALAPTTSAINEGAAGAETGLRARGLSGGVLQTELARLNRQRMSQIGGAFVQAPYAAAQGLGTTATQLLGTGNTAQGNAGMTGANVLGAAAGQSERGLKFGAQSGQGFGQLLAQLLRVYGSGAGKKSTAAGGGSGGAPPNVGDFNFDSSGWNA